MAPSWLAWCSFSLRASNRLHFSTTFRLGCGGGLILAIAGKASPMRSPQPGALLSACIPLVPHQIAARAPRLARLLAPTSCIRRRRAFGGCDPCRLPTSVMTPILRAGGAISLPVLPFLVPGLLCVPGRVLADSDAVSEVLQLCHTPFRSCQVWERFCTGSPCLGAVRRRPWGVAQKPVPSCLALRRCWSFL